MLKSFAAALCLLVFMAAPAFAQEGVIGTIMEVEGKAWITAAGTKERKPAKLESQLHLNDVIETGPQSKTFLLFIDNTQFTLSQNTKFVADEYAFDASAPQTNKAHYNVPRGAFQYQSGEIAKKKDPDVEVDTPYGSIGIRGTKFWAGEVKSAYGVNVSEGRVRVRNDGGETFVDKGKGTSMKSRQQKPSDAMPWPAEQMAFITSTVLLANQDAVFKRVLGFQGKNDILRGQFKDFMKLKGLPGNVLPGNNLPGIPGNKGGMRGNIPMFGGVPGATPSEKATTTTTTPGNRRADKKAADPAKTAPFKMFKGLGL